MPSNVERYDEAIQLQQEGKLDEAISRLQAVVADDPDYALAHAALSKFYSEQEKHPQAVAHGRKVCELEGDDPFSFIALSLVCQKAGMIPEAEQAMYQARQAQVAAMQRQHEA
jgi:predicted Zn-dependent protease